MSDPSSRVPGAGDALPQPTVYDPSADLTVPSRLAGMEPMGTVVLLLVGRAERRWAAQAAVELCTAWAHGGNRIVLADLQLEDPVLHERIESDNLEGVADIFLYGASLARIARPVRGRGFFLIPAGTYAPDPGAIHRHPRWPKLVAGFRDADASLLLFAPAQGTDLDALAEWVTEVVLLGEPPSAAALEPLTRRGIPVRALVVGPTAAPPPADPPAGRREAAAAPAASAPAAAPPPVERAKAPLAPVADRELELELPPPPVRERRPHRGALGFLWLLLLVGLLAAAGFAASRYRPDLFPWAAPRQAPAGQDTLALAPAARRGEPSAAGQPLPYSVQVKSFTSLTAARDQAELDRFRLRGAPFYVVPEEIQGILYYRILAGLAPDTAAATRLRDRLVQVGAVDPEDAAGTWSLIQHTPLAFDLGVYPSAAAAGVAADSLLEASIPSYVVEMPYSDGSLRWQLYGGAYRDSASAERLRQALAAAGSGARLVARAGAPATPAQ
jgi:hypothetical protein